MTSEKKQSPVRINFSSRTGQPISTICRPGKKDTLCSEYLLVAASEVNVRIFLTDQYSLSNSRYRVNLMHQCCIVKFKKDHLNDAVVNTYQFRLPKIL